MLKPNYYLMDLKLRYIEKNCFIFLYIIYLCKCICMSEIQEHIFSTSIKNVLKYMPRIVSELFIRYL